MPQRENYQVSFAPETVDHICAIERKHHSLIRRHIDEQLSYTPERPTRNRKPLEQPAPFGATWELRFGPDDRFRVFYEVKKEATTVCVLAIGVKERDRRYIAGEEFVA